MFKHPNPLQHAIDHREHDKPECYSGSNKKLRVYVASSWRNERQSAVVTRLRDQGHLVYDFKNPVEGDHGFSWEQTGVSLEDMRADADVCLKGLNNEVANRGYALDKAAVDWADVVIMVQPCGVSAAAELAYAAGRGQITVALLRPSEPDLMLKMADMLTTSFPDVLNLCVDLRQRLSVYPEDWPNLAVRDTRRDYLRATFNAIVSFQCEAKVPGSIVDSGPLVEEGPASKSSTDVYPEEDEEGEQPIEGESVRGSEASVGGKSDEDASTGGEAKTEGAGTAYVPSMFAVMDPSLISHLQVILSGTVSEWEMDEAERRAESDGFCDHKGTPTRSGIAAAKMFHGFKKVLDNQTHLRKLSHLLKDLSALLSYHTLAPLKVTLLANGMLVVESVTLNEKLVLGQVSTDVGHFKFPFTLTDKVGAHSIKGPTDLIEHLWHSFFVDQPEVLSTYASSVSFTIDDSLKSKFLKQHSIPLSKSRAPSFRWGVLLLKGDAMTTPPNPP